MLLPASPRPAEGGAGGIWYWIRQTDIGKDMDWEGDAEEEAARREAAARQKDAGKKKRRRGRDDGEPRVLQACKPRVLFFLVQAGGGGPGSVGRQAELQLLASRVALHALRAACVPPPARVGCRAKGT